MCERTFRRYICQYEEEGLEGLDDKRLTQVSHRRAPVDEVAQVTDKYSKDHSGWNATHFYSWYRRDGGSRSYTWVKIRLQDAELIEKANGKDKHRKRRERSPWPEMLLYQDGSTHQWIPWVYWDLIVTMDDATNEHYSMFFVDQEGTASSFRGVQELIEKRGLFFSFYSDRDSHYRYTPQAGGKVDKKNLTQFGRALKQLGIEMIAAFSPEARGRSERMFGTHQGRLTQELALAGITDMTEANRYLRDVYLPAFNAEFMQPAMKEGSAFIPYIGRDLADILCEQHERVVGNDNCVTFEKLVLQIPQNRVRMHYVKVKVRVHCYPDGQLALFHGPRSLARYDEKGVMLQTDEQPASQLRAHG